MKGSGLGLSAFKLPKLKRDVAAKLLPSSRDPGHGSGSHAAAADSNKGAAQQQISTTTDSEAADENVNPESPLVEKVAPRPASKPGTARKGSRRTKQQRVSEQHTVYYDVQGSPEDASTRTQHRTQTLRGAVAAAAAAPTSAHSKPTSRQASAAMADTDADADGMLSGYEPEFFTSQPEPMDEDDLFAGCAGAAAGAAAASTADALKSKTPAAGRKPVRAAQQQQDRVAQPVPRPSSRQQRHAPEQALPAAAGAGSRMQAAADAADMQGAAQNSQQQQPPRRGAAGRSARNSAADAVAEAAVTALDEDVSESDGGSAGPGAAAVAAAGHGSQDHLRDGQEIYKYMKQLAENAGELLPQDEADGGKKRGRGRPKKDMRLVDALHQSWQGKSYYERLQEITRAEMQEEAEQDQHMGADDTTATLALQYNPATLQRPAPHSSIPPCTQAYGSSQQQHEKDGVRPEGAAVATAAATKAGSTGADVPGGRKRRTARQGAQSHAAGASDAEGADGRADGAEAEGGQGAESGTAAAAAAAAAKGPSSKRRATLAAATAAAAAVAGNSRQGNRRATIVTGRTALAGSAAAAKSPLPGARPGSSRLAAWDCTPAAAGGPASLADRPPFTVAPPTAGAAGAGAGAGAAVTAAKAERGVLQKLQASFDSKCEELAGMKEQLKESQDLVSRLRQEQKAHPKALQQLEKQKQVLEKKLDGQGRKEAALQRDNEALQEKLSRQEEEKSALQEQLLKSEREVKALRLKLKQSTAKLERAQALGSKLQELGAGLVADAQPPAFE